MFRAIQQELFFIPALRKFAKLKKKKKKCDGVFLGKVAGLEHPDLLKWNPAMSVGITEMIF